MLVLLLLLLLLLRRLLLLLLLLLLPLSLLLLGLFAQSWAEIRRSALVGSTRGLVFHLSPWKRERGRRNFEFQVVFVGRCEVLTVLEKQRGWAASAVLPLRLQAQQRCEVFGPQPHQVVSRRCLILFYFCVLASFRTTL